MIPKSLIIDGQRMKQRSKIIIDNYCIWLPDKSFRYIALLAIFRRLEKNDGWIPNNILDNYMTARYIYRLKKYIRYNNSTLFSWKVCENRGLADYRLLIELENIIILEKVKEFEDNEVIKYYQKLKELK